MASTKWGDGATETIKFDSALTAPVSAWGTPSAPSYTTLDATPSTMAQHVAPAAPATARPGAGELFKMGAATFAIIGAGTVFVGLGTGSGFVAAIKTGCTVGGAAAVGAWLVLGLWFVVADLGRSFEIAALAKIKLAEVEAHERIELERLRLTHAEALTRADGSKAVALAELEHAGKLREAHARHFELTAGAISEQSPIEDPTRALTQALLLTAYSPSAWDPDGSGRLVAGTISREKAMAQGYTRAQFETASAQLQGAGVLTYGQDRRWRLNRLTYPTAQDAYKATFGEAWG